MTRSNRRFLSGLLLGAGACTLAALTLGAGAGRLAGDLFVTSSADGRNAYLWDASGGSLKFIAAAEAPKGKGGDHADDDHGKRDDHAKPDKDKPEKDKSDKPDDGKGKGKGKG